MSLPKIDTPTFTMVIPSTEKLVKYRPFLVKEEKILLMALEGNDQKEMANALKQIINNCCLDDIDVDALAPFDLEYFFIQLRAKSIGESIELKYTCQKKKAKKLCGHSIDFVVDLDKIQIKRDSDHNSKIELTDDVGIMMKYPDVDYLMRNETEKESAESSLNLIINCMESIYDKNDVHKMKDVDESETKEFLESLTQNQFKKIRQFFDTMPKVVYETTIECDKCEGKNKVEVEGMANFFG